MTYLCVQTGVVTSPKHKILLDSKSQLLKMEVKKTEKTYSATPTIGIKPENKDSICLLAFNVHVRKTFNEFSELNKWMLSERMSWFLISIGYTHTRAHKTNTQNKLTQ